MHGRAFVDHDYVMIRYCRVSDHSATRTLDSRDSDKTGGAGQPRAGSELGTALTEQNAPSAGRRASAFRYLPGRWQLQRQAGLLAARTGAFAVRLGSECTPRAVWQRHRLFAIALVLALIPRILAALAIRPAQMTSDSFLYMREAVTGKLSELRPGGYPFFLTLFRGFPHALLAVTTVQHLMGLAVAVIVYGLLRYWGLPGWGACLLALPTLFDGREISLETYILPDTVFCLVVVLATALLLSRRTPRPWQCIAAALLLAYAAVLRGNGLPLALVAAVFLLLRRVGWKALAASALVFAIPLGGYALAFHSQYHRYNLTESDGLFLWSRTTSFASCATMKVPADLVPLCPNTETPTVPVDHATWSLHALLAGPTPTAYLWAPDAFWRTDKYPGFNAYNNSLAMQFAERAIVADPPGYARAVSANVLETFLTTDRSVGGYYMTFIHGARIPFLPDYYAQWVRRYAGTGNTRDVQPYFYLLMLYQQPVFFPGLLFLAIVAAGLFFVAKDWRRRGGVQLLPWGMAAMSILSPALLTQSLYRYVIVAVPLSCLALGLGIAAARQRQAGPAQAKPKPALVATAVAGPARALTTTAPGGPAGGQR